MLENGKRSTAKKWILSQEKATFETSGNSWCFYSPLTHPFPGVAQGEAAAHAQYPPSEQKEQIRPYLQCFNIFVGLPGGLISLFNLGSQAWESALESFRETADPQTPVARHYMWSYTIGHLRPRGEAGGRLWEMKTFKSRPVYWETGKAIGPGKMHAQKRTEKTSSFHL